MDHDLVGRAPRPPGHPQLASQARTAQLVAPGGTLLVVGHRQGHGYGGHVLHDVVVRARRR